MCQQNTNEPTQQELLLYEKIIARISSVYDPEIPVNVYDLGLIYRILLDADEVEHEKYRVTIDMTLTSIGCPMADLMPIMVQDSIKDMKELSLISVNLIWEPPWDSSRMSDAARLQLDMF